VFQVAHRDVGLDALDRQVHGVAHVHAHAVGAAALRGGAHAATHGLVVYEGLLVARVEAAQRVDAGRAVAAAGHLLGPGLGERTHHHVDHAVGGLGVGRHHRAGVDR